jgi:hypothetical protein
VTDVQHRATAALDKCLRCNKRVFADLESQGMHFVTEHPDLWIAWKRHVTRLAAWSKANPKPWTDEQLAMFDELVEGSLKAENWFR